MKKTLIIIAAFVAVAFISCNKEMELEVVASDDSAVENPSAQGTFSFSAVREDSATKSYLSGTDFLWEDGEEISVCYGASNVRFTYDGASGKFTSDAFDPEAAGPFYVVAPYNAGITIDGSGKIHTELPALQTAGSHGLDPAALLSVGKAADVAALTAGVSLKNAFSLVKVAINDTDVNRISIDGNYSGTDISPLIAGEVTVDPADGSAVATGRGTSVSLVPSAGNFEAGAYILAVLPQTMSNGIKIVFRREGEAQSYYRNSAKSISFTRNAGISFAAVTAADLESRCYFVADAADLVAWDGVGSRNGTDKVFLGADINMDGQSWTPVNNYAGVFDGQNHRIHHLSVSTNQYVGFIRANKDEESVPAVLRNAVFGTVDGENWDGVSNFTHATSAKTDTWYYAGVFAKTYQAAEMTDVINFAKVEVASAANGKTRIGGLCGNWASTASMTRCKNYGTVVNNASTASAASAMAGIVGQCDEAADFLYCENYGDVTCNCPGVQYVAGILASSSYANSADHCVNRGNISFVAASKATYASVISGIVAYLNNAGTISNCENRGDLTIDNEGIVNIGGVLGLTKKAISVSDCDNYGDIILNKNNSGATCMAGGVVGYAEAEGFSLARCNNHKDFTWSVFKKTFYGGGVFGELDYATITDCTNYGSITVPSGGTYGAYASFGGVGGIVYRPTTRITGCVNNGELNIYFKHTVRLGGIVGTFNRNGDIKDCTNNANVTLEVNTANHNGLWHAVGGIAGVHEGDASRTATVSGCVNNGTVHYFGSCAPKAESAQHNYGEGVGGIMGTCVIQTTFSDNVNNGDVIALNSSTVPFEVGGILGRAKVSDNISTSGNINYGDVSSANSTGLGSIAGGVIGNAIVASFTATGDTNYGAVTCDDATQVGSIAGLNAATLTNCKAGGSVNGTALTSVNFGSYVQGSESTGTESGTSFVSLP